MAKVRVRINKIQLSSMESKPINNLYFLKNMDLFCREFNEKTRSRNGELVNVEIVVYTDKSYEYSVGASLGVYLLKDRHSDYKKLKKDEKIKAREKERKEFSEELLTKVAQEIMPSLNTDDLEKAKKIVAGTVRSFGGAKISK